MIRVLVVDDSLVQQELLTHILNSDPAIKVIDTALDGKEAIEKAEKLKPDLITMDLHLPRMNGIEATRIIMETNPIPIVVISSSCIPHETKEAFDALDAGALAILDKVNFALDKGKEIIKTVKSMSEVKLVRRYPKFRKFQKPSLNGKEQKTSKDYQYTHKNKPSNIFKLIAIGASTGGPSALQDIFKNMNSTYPPILVVQHIAPTFLEGLVEWLKESTQKQIKIAIQKEKVESSCIYFAPNEYQMGIDSEARIVLSHAEPNNGHKPSVNYLFKSVATVMPTHTLGVLLTGMGRDGAEGLKLLKEKGGSTIAQDEKSSVIFGMPGEAVALNAADFVLNPLDIANFINEIQYEPS